jgi:hypothetical protein
MYQKHERDNPIFIYIPHTIYLRIPSDISRNPWGSGEPRLRMAGLW